MLVFLILILCVSAENEELKEELRKEIKEEINKFYCDRTMKVEPHKSHLELRLKALAYKERCKEKCDQWKADLEEFDKERNAALKGQEIEKDLRKAYGDLEDELHDIAGDFELAPSENVPEKVREKIEEEINGFCRMENDRKEPYGSRLKLRMNVAKDLGKYCKNGDEKGKIAKSCKKLERHKTAFEDLHDSAMNQTTKGQLHTAYRRLERRYGRRHDEFTTKGNKGKKNEEKNKRKNKKQHKNDDDDDR